LTQHYRGQLLAYDIALDLALIQIEQFDEFLAWIEFADSERVVCCCRRSGLCIGHPEQGGLYPSFSP
jgi:hypothetical protein